MHAEPNPYHPPLETNDLQVGESIRKIVARASVVLYGVLFTLFCIAGTIDDVISREPILETLFWLAMSVLTCYGIFALAIRRFRILQLNRFWWYFGAALPLLTYLGAGWEIYHQPTMPPIEFAAVFAMFVLMTTPGLICNWMLRSRLSSPAKDGG